MRALPLERRRREREITLVGYCDFNKMLQYRLDMETALVLASAVQIQAPDSASAEGGGNCVVTVEHMQKISDKHAAALSVSMALEWKSVLTPLFFESHKFGVQVLCVLGIDGVLA